MCPCVRERHFPSPVTSCVALPQLNSPTAQYRGTSRSCYSSCRVNSNAHIFRLPVAAAVDFKPLVLVAVVRNLQTENSRYRPLASNICPYKTV